MCVWKAADIREVRQIARMANNYHGVSVLLATHPQPRTYIFRNLEDRERFIAVFYQTRSRAVALAGYVPCRSLALVSAYQAKRSDKGDGGCVHV